MAHLKSAFYLSVAVLLGGPERERNKFFRELDFATIFHLPTNI